MASIWAAVSAITGIAALAVVVVATTYAFRQLREVARARTASVLLEFQKWHTQEAARSFRRRLLAGDLGDVTKLNPVEAGHLEDEVDRLEFLGMLVEKRLIEASVAEVFYRYSPRLVWEKAKPFILQQRKVAPGYGEYLQRFQRR